MGTMLTLYPTDSSKDKCDEETEKVEEEAEKITSQGLCCCDQSDLQRST